LASLEAGNGTEAASYYQADLRGPSVITDASGHITTRLNTLPFGNAPGASVDGPSAPLFTSYQRSSRTGLDYAINRYYNPMLGRFLQPDPVGVLAARPQDPQSLNMYAYAGNDPTNEVDANGLDDSNTTGCESPYCTIVVGKAPVPFTPPVSPAASGSPTSGTASGPSPAVKQQVCNAGPTASTGSTPPPTTTPPITTPSWNLQYFGLSVTGALLGAAGLFGFGIVTDQQGTAALYVTGGAGGSNGTIFSHAVGFSGGWGTTPNVAGFGGPFANVSWGMGAGGRYTIDYYSDPNNSASYGGGLTVGIGEKLGVVGNGGSLLYTRTKLSPSVNILLPDKTLTKLADQYYKLCH
jgi:RHS repeat-associated protein